MRLLLLADIHGNFPALAAVDRHFAGSRFDAIVNCGDSVVYAPFPNETIDWLINRQAVSILGNTDKKVLKLLDGIGFKKPSKPEKRVMYTTTASALSATSRNWLRSLENSVTLPLPGPVTSGDPRSTRLAIFHGSPDAPNEHLFATTPSSRFSELASAHPYRVIVTGHSHTPYHHCIGATHFINPGSVGRMFDGNPDASCAVLTISADELDLRHYRIAYDIERLIGSLHELGLPPIYDTMYRQGRKLN